MALDLQHGLNRNLFQTAGMTPAAGNNPTMRNMGYARPITPGQALSFGGNFGYSTPQLNPFAGNGTKIDPSSSGGVHTLKPSAGGTVTLGGGSPLGKHTAIPGSNFDQTPGGTHTAEPGGPIRPGVFGGGGGYMPPPEPLGRPGPGVYPRPGAHGPTGYPGAHGPSRPYSDLMARYRQTSDDPWLSIDVNPLFGSTFLAPPDVNGGGANPPPVNPTVGPIGPTGPIRPVNPTVGPIGPTGPIRPVNPTVGPTAPTGPLGG